MRLRRESSSARDEPDISSTITCMSCCGRSRRAGTVRQDQYRPAASGCQQAEKPMIRDGGQPKFLSGESSMDVFSDVTFQRNEAAVTCDATP
jgi:hypothetical protein